MKLIDILVRELPLLGGWPEDKTVASHGPENCVMFHELGRAPFVYAGLKFEGNDIVTKEEYEAALAASKPEWDGEGLPQVGCECEYETKFDGWQPVRIELIKSEGIAFTWLANSQAYNGLACVGVQKAGSFRPIRSEADKKRENGVLSLAKAAGAMPFRYGETLSDGELLGSSWYELYDKIAAGEVAGISID